MNKLLIFIFTLLVGVPTIIQAQTRQKQNYPITLSNDLEIASATDQFHLYLKGNHNQIEQLVTANGGVVKGEIKGYVAVLDPANTISILKQSPSVEAIKGVQTIKLTK